MPPLAQRKLWNCWIWYSSSLMSVGFGPMIADDRAVHPVGPHQR